MLKIIEKKDWNKNRTISSEKLKIRILNSDSLKEISCDFSLFWKSYCLVKLMVISLVEVDIYYYFICNYAGFNQSEVAFLTEKNIEKSHGREIFVCNLTGDFMSGINLLQSRDITVKEPPRFYSYIGYGKSDIKIGLSTLWQRSM